ncbi:U1 small nuclear ribonucleoprotein C-like [Durio zibethinus]|uniref:U1 small nuclear ribonucleoprotein C-like n=1 Tax=Durio zibethinus TaxID=66656 RepID=A0A6P5XJM8_DURZI|nr:U1 small nuclear ribonucleoprotein C-like [Durio zibethinus]
MPRHQLENNTMQANVRTYYQQFEQQLTQSLIDQRIKEHLGQAAVFQQVGAAFNQHLMAQRPRLPVLPTHIMPIPGAAPLPVNQLMVPGIRPPVLPRPVPGAPGYIPVPVMPPMMGPPGAPSLPGQVNGLPWPPTLAPPNNSSWSCNDTHFFYWSTHNGYARS